MFSPPSSAPRGRKEVSVDNSRKTVENCVENCGKTSQLSTVIIPISGTVDNSHSYSHIILTTFHTFPLMPMQSINRLIINRLKTIYSHHFMSYPHFPQPIIIIKNILKVLKKKYYYYVLWKTSDDGKKFIFSSLIWNHWFFLYGYFLPDFNNSSVWILEYYNVKVLFYKFIIDILANLIIFLTFEGVFQYMWRQHVKFINGK